jgi:hypothetical protein
MRKAFCICQFLPQFSKFMKREDFVKKRKELATRPIEELIELLSSENLQTRFFAEMCLRDATGL